MHTQTGLCINKKKSEVVILDNQFFLLRQLSKGSHSITYLAIDKYNTLKYCVAEMKGITQYHKYPINSSILQTIQESNVSAKIIKQGFYQNPTKLYHFTIYEQLGPSLKLCFQSSNKVFSELIIAIIAIQALQLLEKLHQQLIIYCNLKPKKLLISRNETELKLMDFKFAQRLEPKKLLFSNTCCKTTKTASYINKYSSINIHLNIKPQYKDDLESLAYILINFALEGKLFNQFQNYAKAERAERVKEWETIKTNLILDPIFQRLPNELIQFYYLVRMSTLQNFIIIDYSSYIKLFTKMLQRNQIHSETSPSLTGLFDKFKNQSIQQKQQINLRLQPIAQEAKVNENESSQAFSDTISYLEGIDEFENMKKIEQIKSEPSSPRLLKNI